MTGQGGASWFAWRGVGWLGGHGTSPLGPGAGVYSRASRRAATAPNCWTGWESRRPDPLLLGEQDAVSREVTRGAGRTRGARNPICKPWGPARSPGSLCLRPPGEGLTWAAGSLPPPAKRPAPRSPAPPALAMSRAAGSAALPALLAPGRAPAPPAGADSPRAPRPAPPPRLLGRRHRSRRRLAAPSRSLKGAERRPRRPPSAPPGRD